MTTARSLVPPRPKRNREPVSNPPPLFLLREVLKRGRSHGLRLVHGPENLAGIPRLQIVPVGVLLPGLDKSLRGLEPAPFAELRCGCSANGCPTQNPLSGDLPPARPAREPWRGG